MFIDIIKNRLEQGIKTNNFPKEDVILSKNYRGVPIVNSDCDNETINRCAESCPQQAIDPIRKSMDLRKCVFCGECERISEGRFIRFTNSYKLGSSSEESLVVDGENKAIEIIAKEYFQKTFGRSLQLRVVSAGGCNACEADINVLNTPVFDLSRFGIQFVASPRHADGLLIVGPVTKNMEYALKQAYEAVPNPKVVIASGACALSGGPFRDNEQQLNGVSDLLKVDLFVPGCPPHPMSLLHALVTFFIK